MAARIAPFTRCASPVRFMCFTPSRRSPSPASRPRSTILSSFGNGCGTPKRITERGLRQRGDGVTKRKIEVEESGGNIFADLELPDADELLLKAQLVSELRRLIEKLSLTQTAAARLTGVAQPDLSNLLRG